MRCRTCDYPLWNTTSRTCPECGNAFRPGDFDFLPNSVRFCCPHCDQSYYGQTERGHLAPSEFDCVRCGRHVSMDEMIVRPAAGVQERKTAAHRMPWLERSERGRVRSWFATVGMSMIQPHRLMRAVPVDGGRGEAWGYAALTIGVFLLTGVFSAFVVLALIDLTVGNAKDWLGILTAGLGFFAGAIAAVLLLVLAWGLVAHLILELTGGATHPIGRTYQALCYGAGANATWSIPCIGTYPFGFIGLIWWMVSSIFTVKEAQLVSGGRATFAVLTFPLAALVLVVGAYFTLIFYMISQPGTFGMPMPAGTETAVLTESIIAWADEHDGDGPGHAALLVVDTELAAGNFASSVVGNEPADVMLSDHTLQELDTLPENRRRLAVTAVLEALPDDPVVHRAGDFVFTYHGIDLRDAPDPDLWIVLLAPPVDPATGAAPAILAVGLADGTTRTFAAQETQVALDGQNRLREGVGLEPIPPPWEVE
ncbi:MAG: hypothetical protein ACYTG1_00440 [Planctomycetota bacterium]|jgi:hypothetical protein